MDILEGRNVVLDVFQDVRAYYGVVSPGAGE
jgi:hypothetical protein